MKTTLVPAVLAAVGVGLAACGHSPPTRFFTLDPLAPAAASASLYAGPPVRVDAVHIPPQLDRPELVRQPAANEIVVEDFAQWAAPLGEIARRALTQDLMARLPAGVVIFPDAPKPPAASGLVVDILAVNDGDSATLDASWTILPARPAGKGSTISVQPHAVRVSAPRIGTGPDAQAARFSRLLAALADSIAASL